MSSTDWTIGRLLTWTADYLKQHGSESPRLDAEVLLAYVKKCQRIMLYTAFDEVAAEPVRTAYRDLVKRRAEGTPVAYLVGQREFYSLSFQVTPDVLIPRPETEHLVVRLLDLIEKRGSEPVRVADVGTGSGIIAVTIAKLAPQIQVTAIDISPTALAVARQNATTHGVADRITFVESDLFAAVPGDAKFDFIASNPPYIGTAEMSKLSPTVRDHEPRLALEAGPRGTEVLERLIPQAVARLNSGGWFLSEISPLIEPAVRSLVEQHSELVLGPTLKDLAQHPRVVHAQRQ